MKVEILQAGTGDSIWISNNKLNIVIDGGKDTSAILDKYNQLPQNENIDLLVVTHIDSDHIAGVLALVEQIKVRGETERLKRVWFNYPKREENGEYSINEGNKLSDSLCRIKGLNWCNNTSEMIGNAIQIGDMTLFVLAPDRDVADEYSPKEPDELSAGIADWDVNLDSLVANVNDDDLDKGGPNSQSIVILLECNEKKVLLPGDCTPKELYNAIRKYSSTKEQPITLELMKLPHHGSMRNVTKDILSEVECANYVISTNVNKKYCFPHKETIAKLIGYRKLAEKELNVYFNYKDSLDILCISEEEQIKNNINLTVCREFNI